MKADQDKIKDIFDYLCDELDRGNHFYQIAKTLQRAYEGNRLAEAPYFFAGVYDACMRESILSLAKLTVPDNNSITIDYLLNTVLQNHRAFKLAATNDIEMAVARHQRQLNKELRPLIDSVKGQRDRVIAHLDRKHINDPSAILSNKVNMTEVGQCFEVLLQMVNTYKVYYDAVEFSFDLIERSVQSDVNYLITLMEKAHE